MHFFYVVSVLLFEIIKKKLNLYSNYVQVNKMRFYDFNQNSPYVENYPPNSKTKIA